MKTALAEDRKASTRLKGQQNSSDCPIQAAAQAMAPDDEVQLHPPMLSPQDHPEEERNEPQLGECSSRAIRLRISRGIKTRQGGREIPRGLTAKEDRDGVSRRSKNSQTK